MKSGKIGIFNPNVMGYVETKVYERFSGRDIWDAKMSCMFNDVPLSEYNKPLFDLLHTCLLRITMEEKILHDEEDLLMNIATHRFKYLFSQK